MKKNIIKNIYELLISVSRNELIALHDDLNSTSSFVYAKLTIDKAKQLEYILKYYRESSNYSEFFSALNIINTIDLQRCLFDLSRLLKSIFDFEKDEEILSDNHVINILHSMNWHNLLYYSASRNRLPVDLQKYIIKDSLRNFHDNSNPLLLLLWKKMQLTIFPLDYKFNSINDEISKLDNNLLNLRYNFIIHFFFVDIVRYYSSVVFYERNVLLSFYRELFTIVPESEIVNFPISIRLNAYILLIDYKYFILNENEYIEYLNSIYLDVTNSKDIHKQAKVYFTINYVYNLMIIGKISEAHYLYNCHLKKYLNSDSLLGINIETIILIQIIFLIINDDKLSLSSLVKSIDYKGYSDSFLFVLAWAHFYLNDFSTALRMAKSIETIHRDKQGFGMGIRILEILCYIESKQFDGIEYAFVNLKNQITWLKRQGKLKPRYHYLYKLLLKLHNTGYDYRKTYKMMKEKIHLMDSTDPYWRWDVRSPEAMPVQLWFLRRMTNNSKLKGVSQISPEDSK